MNFSSAFAAAKTTATARRTEKAVRCIVGIVRCVVVVVVGAAKWRGKYVFKVLKWLAQG